jgi:hypothetical protein
MLVKTQIHAVNVLDVHTHAAKESHDADASEYARKRRDA